MKKLLSLIVLLIYFVNLQAQTLGPNPNGQNWQIIEFDAGSIIFPKGMEAQSKRVANMINYQNRNLDRSVGPLKKKISIIFQNQTVIPNGNVTTAPYRSRFYSTAFEGLDRLGTMDWFDVLAVHEYRHVQQLNNTQHGLTKAAKFLFGDYGWTLAAFIGVPIWYFEGDAVVAETMFTKAGRGRTPHFTLQQRAMAYDNINPNYTLASNNSYKLNQPNQYPRGYMMLSHLRNEKGNDVIKDILRDGSAYKKIIYPFSRSMKEHTGWSTKDLYNESWSSAKNLWKRQLEKTSLNPTTRITKMNEKVYTDYSFPFFDKNDNIIVLKNSFDTTSEIVRLEDAKEKTLVRPGISLVPYLQYKNGVALWTEITSDPRRNNQSYSNICSYNFSTNKKINLTKKGKYFSPCFGDSTDEIYALHQSPLQISSLHKIDSKSGVETAIHSFQAGDNVARLQAKGNSLVYIIKRKSQIAIWKYDVSTKTEIQLTPWTAHVIDHLHLHGNYVYYMGGFTGIENIYRSTLNGDKTIQQISSVPIGAFYPSVSQDGNTLLFTEHTYMGSVISSMDLKQYSQRAPSNFQYKEPVDMEWQDKVAAETEGGSYLDNVPTETFVAKEYKGVFKGLRLHSWGLEPDNGSINVFLDSDNLLEDLSLDFSTGINLDNQQRFMESQISFGRFLPVFNLTHKIQKENLQSVGQLRNESSFEIEIPLAWTTGNFYNVLKPLFAFNNTHLQKDGEAKPQNFQGINSEFSYDFIRQSAYQNLGPRFGLTTDLQFQQNYTETTSEKFTADLAMFFPGIKKNHSLKLSGSFQKITAENISTFDNNFVYPRGFTIPTAKKFSKFSVDYSFPLFYPDKGIRGLVFLQRISSNLFFDIGSGLNQNEVESDNYQSIGLDFIFDLNLLNIAPIGIGFRNSILLTEDPKSPNTVYTPSIFFISDL